MKRFLAAMCLGLMAFATQASAAEPAKIHIGICTGTVSQSEDDLRGAEALIKNYGDVANGGMIKHITYPDNFMTEMETTISQIVSFADDPDMKAVIVNQGIPGTTAAFQRIREKRPDIMLLVGEAHEDPNVIESAADLAINADNISRGYLIIAAAKKLGVTDFVHISFPRHMSYELLSRRRNIMEVACKDLGVNFHFMSAPDPTSDVGVAGAQQYILEQVPQWLDKLGPKTAFFCTNDAHTEPLLKRLTEDKGGYFIEADLPSPLMGYPGALGIDLADVSGNFPAILKRVEDTVIAKGAAGRMGTWTYSYGFTNSLGLGELAIKYAKEGVTGGRSFRRHFKKEDVFEAYNAATPGSTWSGGYYVDVATGKEKKNHVLVFEDLYIFGKGYMHMTEVPVPDKYKSIK